MSWKDAKRAQALTKSDNYYTPKQIQEAWEHVLSGQYADIIIYSLFYETNKPFVNINKLDPYEAMFREGKRDIVDQVLRYANKAMTGKDENNG